MGRSGRMTVLDLSAAEKVCKREIREKGNPGAPAPSFYTGPGGWNSCPHAFAENTYPLSQFPSPKRVHLNM